MPSDSITYTKYIFNVRWPTAPRLPTMSDFPYRNGGRYYFGELEKASQPIMVIPKLFINREHKINVKSLLQIFFSLFP